MRRIIEFFKGNYQDIFKPILVLLSICVVIPLALAVTNGVTKDKISALSEKNRNTAMLRLVKADTFEENTLRLNGEEITYYSALKGEEPIAFLFINQDKGYGGTVEVMTAVDTEGNIKAVEILDVSSETPGLGQNTAKESFYSQFKGKKGEITVVKNNANGELNEINAVTGATISSSAVTRAVNAALEQFGALPYSALGGAGK